MLDTITLTGIVATEPRHVVTTEGLAITTFRLASGQRRFDRATNAWVDADANWYTISAFRLLAGNVARSVQKGQHVIVSGRLRLRDWTSGERSGTSVEIAAESLGHDLNWYMTTAIRTSLTAQAPPSFGAGPTANGGASDDIDAPVHGPQNGCAENDRADPDADASADADADAGADASADANEATHPAPAHRQGASSLVPVDF